jgi:hypothetical protein
MPSIADKRPAVQAAPLSPSESATSPQRLSHALINSLPLPTHSSRTTYDDSVKGFGIRVTVAGTKSFVLSWRKPDGKLRRLTIGRFPVWTVAAAREEAKRLKCAIYMGGDPIADPYKLSLKNLEQRIADKALAFLNQNLEPACYLYRHYHPNGDLLYVGISLDAVARQRRHAKGAIWHNLICRIVIEPFETREQALEAEQVAIKTEFPKFNTVYNGRDLLREVTTFTRESATKKTEHLKENMSERGGRQ